MTMTSETHEDLRPGDTCDVCQGSGFTSKGLTWTDGTSSDGAYRITTNQLGGTLWVLTELTGTAAGWRTLHLSEAAAMATADHDPCATCSGYGRIPEVCEYCDTSLTPDWTSDGRPAICGSARCMAWYDDPG